MTVKTTKTAIRERAKRHGRDRAQILIDGVPVEVVSDAIAERADYVVCVPWTTPATFDGDEQGTCVACGVAVRFRPYMPKTPPKICLPCMFGLLRKQ